MGHRRTAAAGRRAREQDRRDPGRSAEVRRHRWRRLAERQAADHGCAQSVCRDAVRNGSEEGASYDVSVQVESGRRLLIVVVASREGIPRKSPQIGQLVRTLQEDAGPQDRIVLAANAFCETPVSSRQDPVAPDALRIIQGLGANFMRCRRCSDSGNTRSRIWRARRASFGCTRRTAGFSDNLNSETSNLELRTRLMSFVSLEVPGFSSKF